MSTKDTSKYAKLGVDSDKGNVRASFKGIIENDFPGSFVNIIYDPGSRTTNNILKYLGLGAFRKVVTQHQDGDGSKMVQRLLHLAVTGENTLGYALDDALAMNGSDIAASGFVYGPWIVTQLINSSLAPEFKQLLMDSLSARWLELKEFYEAEGFELHFMGGETADLPDQVRSSTFDMTLTAYAKAGHVIKGNVCLGDKIWGFASDGRAIWENADNSGIMSNGLTLLRSCLMSAIYDKDFPDLKRAGEFYVGRYKVDDQPEPLGMSVSEALMSPTRQWPILINRIFEKISARGCRVADLIHGISINTGGGATKIKHVGNGGIMYMKNMPPAPAIFRLIQSESGESWDNMYKTFNCGVGIDIIAPDDPLLQEVLEEVSAETMVPVYELGVCAVGASSQDKNSVVLNTSYGTFDYQ
ncbi:MAG: hypothetical protein WC453_02620 [Patescibacteria group bacterium]